MKSRSVFQAFLAGVMLVCAPPLALAQNPSPVPATAASQEAQDEALVRQALGALARRGYSGLRPFMTQLSEVAARAPASYPRVETKGAITTIRVMEGDPDASLPSMVQTLAARPGAPKSANIRMAFNLYGAAYFMRGAFALENRLPEAAIVELDKGLALQPDNVDMIAEKGSALSLLHKWPEMLQLYDDALGHDWPFISADQKGRMLRGKGAALTQLGRLDDSEAAYNQSLAITPGNQNALDGLTYIARLRAGGPTATPDLTLPNQPPRVRPMPTPVGPPPVLTRVPPAA
ncbi:MAG: tetratricopeptide repeat protein [Alphaproteobacteria bacterium]